MARLPRLRGRELIAALRRGGFVVADGRATVVPVRSGETIGPGLLNQILADVEMTGEELRELL
jgi:predicted RNA binding protein YcfA (HicA-like mRNA interferase family)